MKEIPAVSVIIPLYNVEKYVAECLDSILAQTFQDFEVIVVDDCSTDSSPTIVESLAKNFNGRLKLAKMKTNSGGAGFPRNKGIELSRGKYLAFIDPDDTITPTALEELYTLAKKFNADVVHCEKWYPLTNEFYNDAEYRKNVKPYSWPTKEKIFVTQPILLTNDFEKRIGDFVKGWLTWSVCLQLVRRDFLIDNEIKFANIYSEDLVFTMCEICCAQKYLVVPNVFYLYRLREGSAVRESFDVPKLIRKYSLTLKRGIRYLDEFSSRHELLKSRTDLKYSLFNMFVISILGRLTKVYNKIPVHALDELLRREFNGDDAALSSFIFSAFNICLLQLEQARQQNFRLNQFAAAAQNRITQLESEIRQLKSEE